MFTSVGLDCFSVYRPHNSRKMQHNKSRPAEKDGQVFQQQLLEFELSNELASLHDLFCTRATNDLFFDGVICFGQERRYVQGVPFRTLSIGGYEDTELHTVRPYIWIQSNFGKEMEIWYRFETPSAEYRRYYEPFLWVADFAKHVIDYLHENRDVALLNFREHFHTWLQEYHGIDYSFQRWLALYSGHDFRRAIAAHSTFILKEALQLSDNYESHLLWREVDPASLMAVPEQPRLEHLALVEEKTGMSGKTVVTEKTVVTPFVFHCFKHMQLKEIPWAPVLDPQYPSMSVLQASQKKKAEMKLSIDLRRGSTNQQSFTSLPSDFQLGRASKAGTIRVGDVVELRSDEDSRWKSSHMMMYAYVQGIKSSKRGQVLKVIWFYRPNETTCLNMDYPFANELFLSDHCNCDSPPIPIEEVVRKVRTDFFKGPYNTSAEFFVRQKYVSTDAAFVTLQDSDFNCNCEEPDKIDDYLVGDTLLVRKSEALEPVVLVGYAPNGFTTMARVRCLLQRASYYGHNDADPNELVYTNRYENVVLKDIFRRCNVRFYSMEEKVQNRIPAPYCRRGTADAYYIIFEESETPDTGLRRLQKPAALNQGPDYAAVPVQQKMKGMDIFCGGGNFGRGLQECGAVINKWAIDWYKEAMHTYRANHDDPDNVKLFFGSVNSYLSQAMRGSANELIAPVGDVDMIAAGSPCQGFSVANQQKGSEKSRREVSMVASVVSYVDLYSPKYALLENVKNMATNCGTKEKEKNVFSQAICALVGMGYQVRQFNLDAWNFGSPQSRSRLFISIAAPGLVPMPDPPQSHSHLALTRNSSLGKTLNGCTFGDRYQDPTPFEYITIGEATADLPVNHDGRVTCISFPDHRPVRSESTFNRLRISSIPLFPAGMSFVKACKRGWMPSPQFNAFHWERKSVSRPASRSWQRAKENALLPTVLTRCTPQDSYSGSILHWSANRCLTVMEVRRAQGFPDHEILVGLPAEQWKIVGNSVDRSVALALGMALRTAWVRSTTPFVSPADISSVDKQEESQKTTALGMIVTSRPSGEQLSSDRPVINGPKALKRPRTSTTLSISDKSDELGSHSTFKRVAPSTIANASSKRLPSSNTPQTVEKLKARPGTLSIDHLSSPLPMQHEVIDISSDSSSDENQLNGFNHYESTGPNPHPESLSTSPDRTDQENNSTWTKETTRSQTVFKLKSVTTTRRETISVPPTGLSTPLRVQKVNPSSAPTKRRI